MKRSVERIVENACENWVLAENVQIVFIYFDRVLGSAPDPTKSTDWSVSVGSVTSPTDPTLGFRIEIGRLVGWSVGGRTFGRSVVGFAYAFFKIQLSRTFPKKVWRLL